jgi:hypothetical protein
VQSTFQVVKEAERDMLGAQQVITRQTPWLLGWSNATREPRDLQRPTAAVSRGVEWAAVRLQGRKRICHMLRPERVRLWLRPILGPGGFGLGIPSPAKPAVEPQVGVRIFQLLRSGPRLPLVSLHFARSDPSCTLFSTSNNLHVRCGLAYAHRLGPPSGNGCGSAQSPLLPLPCGQPDCITAMEMVGNGKSIWAALPSLVAFHRTVHCACSSQ